MAGQPSEQENYAAADRLSKLAAKKKMKKMVVTTTSEMLPKEEALYAKDPADKPREPAPEEELKQVSKSLQPFKAQSESKTQPSTLPANLTPQPTQGKAALI